MARRAGDGLAVLFTGAGRRVELLDCFRRDARALGRRLRVVAADLQPELSAACHFADAVHRVPPVDHADYIDALLAVCQAESVGLVVPLLPQELPVLASARRRFARAGVAVAVSSPETVALCGDKLRTAQHLEARGVAVPKTERLDRALAAPADWTWPVIVKPIAGSASKGVHVVGNEAHFRHLDLDPETHVVQTRIDGAEYTVNVFFDRAGRLQCAVPHRRIEVRAGEVSKAVTERSPMLMETAARLGRALPGARGPLCFQAMVGRDGFPRVIEINARFGGGFPLAHRAGARFPLWMMQEALGLEPDFVGDAWRDGLLMLRCDRSIFRVCAKRRRPGK